MVSLYHSTNSSKARCNILSDSEAACPPDKASQLPTKPLKETIGVGEFTAGLSDLPVA